MKKSLPLFLCLLCALIVLTACGTKDAPPAGDTAPEEETIQPESTPEPEPGPEPEPEPFVPYADEKGIEFIPLTATDDVGLEADFVFKTRDDQDTEDIELKATVMSDSYKSGKKIFSQSSHLYSLTWNAKPATREMSIYSTFIRAMCW